MDKVILDAINHIKNSSKRKLSLDNILQRINKISATNLNTKALRSELEKMIFKGLIDQNYRVLNKKIPQTDIEPSANKVRFTIDGSTEDETKIDFYETSSLIGAQDLRDNQKGPKQHPWWRSPTLHPNGHRVREAALF